MGIARANLFAAERRVVKSRDADSIFSDGQIPSRILMANMTDVRPSFRGICAAAVRHFTPLERRSKPRFRASLVHQNKVMRAVAIDSARALPVRQSLLTVILASYQMMTVSKTLRTVRFASFDWDKPTFIHGIGPSPLCAPQSAISGGRLEP